MGDKMATVAVFKVDKNATDAEWQDLDDESYNNHFSNGQCQLKIEFNRSTNESPTLNDSLTLDLPIYPEDITFGSTTNYASADILGRPGPIAGYVSTSDVTSRISLHLHRELKNPGTKVYEGNMIDNIVSAIQACAYPKSYQDALYVPIVTYTFGDTIITGKQTSWNVKWGGPKIGGKYMEVTIDVAISHVPSGIEFFNDVLGHNPRQFK